MKKIIILSCDPGLVNHSYCVCEYTKKGRKILAAGMLKYTIRSLIKEELDSQLFKYTKQFIKLINTYHPTHFAAERFQVRGVRQQSIVECVTLMLGILTRIMQKKKIDMTLITAACWKNHFQKTYKKLDEIYKDGAAYKVPPHVIDGNLIGWYIAQKEGYFSYKYLYKDYLTWIKTLQKLLEESNENR